jgi:hypothetical protein
VPCYVCVCMYVDLCMCAVRKGWRDVRGVEAWGILFERDRLMPLQLAREATLVGRRNHRSQGLPRRFQLGLITAPPSRPVNSSTRTKAS